MITLFVNDNLILKIPKKSAQLGKKKQQPQVLSYYPHVIDLEFIVIKKILF